ncbi:MAG: WG repeat-containing protein [Lachnospiraceae bacterium]|nr:WG repeat-containing protein [Lachnospiraceae bacterium]
MKGKRMMVVLPMIFILLIGWLLTMQTMTGAESKKKQNELKAQADIYAGKELYIRAIPLYEEALVYETDLNSEIENALLECYKSYGDAESYKKLAELRISEARATEQEYITVADYYISGYKLDEAMDVVKKGMDKLDSEVLKEYFEANRYAYAMKISRYDDIMPTDDNQLMPAFDGEKWGYVNSSGRLELQAVYDTVTPFNSSGYAVVSQGGKYYTITNTGAKYGVDEVGVTDVYRVTNRHILAQVNGKYSYYNLDFECVAQTHQYDQITANACGLAAVKSGDKWGIITDAGEKVVDFILEDVAVNSLGTVFTNNVAMVKMDGLWYLIDTTGAKILDIGFANAKAPESDGYIAVADKEGLWGFIDQKGEMVISYQYSDALSFSNHLGAVKSVDNWGYISESNVLVIEEELLDAQPFHDGIAQAKFIDGEAIITLSYFEE